MSKKEEKRPFDILFYPEDEKNPTFTKEEFKEMISITKTIGQEGYMLLKSKRVTVTENDKVGELQNQYEAALKEIAEIEKNRPEEDGKIETIEEKMKAIYG